MRQHAIPQNVLDVEFKLFTRFTLKEFAYLAAGLVGGGIFLYYSIGGDLPGIFGIPMFALLAGSGAFMALVPINDQPADVFIRNYFTAINNPTQRVWLNDEMKEKRIKPEVKSTTAGGESGNAKFVGGAKIPGAKSVEVFQEKQGDDILEEVSDDVTVKNDVKEEIKEVVRESSEVLNSEDVLTISEENLGQFQFPIKSVDQLNGNINVWVNSGDNQPLPGINIFLKDSNNKVLYANKTGPNGYFLSDKMYDDGIYFLEMEKGDGSSFRVRIILSKKFGKLPLRVQFK